MPNVSSGTGKSGKWGKGVGALYSHLFQVVQRRSETAMPIEIQVELPGTVREANGEFDAKGPVRWRQSGWRKGVVWSAKSEGW